MSPPVGLHVHLVGVGASLRVALWFERTATPQEFKSFSGSSRRVPHKHPFACTHRDRPTWLPDATRAVVCVNLPRLGSYFPLALPAGLRGWDLDAFVTPESPLGWAPYRVPAHILHPQHSLVDLRRILRGWRHRHGPGAMSPHAGVILDLLDRLHARFTEGPLLPSCAPVPMGLDGQRAPTEGSDPRVVWTPPVSLAELHALVAPLRGLPSLPALDMEDLQSSPNPTAPGVGWLDDREPARFANFILEVFGAHAERTGSAPRVSSDEVMHRVVQGEVAPMHRDHGSCLYPEHPVFSPPRVPRASLQGRLSPSEPTETSPAGWTLELGLAREDSTFLPLRTIVASRPTHDGAMEHDGAVWFRPSSMLERDWRAQLAFSPGILALPEALTGTMVFSESDGLALMSQPAQQGDITEYSAWFERIGERGRGRPPASWAFRVTAETSGAVGLRVRWELDGDAEPDSVLRARFVPHMELAVGDATLLAADAERLVKSTTAAFVKVEGKVVGRAELVAAIELLRAREKVIQRLSTGASVSWARAVELDDEWNSDKAAALTESVFAARWEAFLGRLKDGSGVPALSAPEGFLGTLRPYQLRGLSWMAFLTERGFSGCLADDMGLGKTVQVLALLMHRRNGRRDGADLVVCPTSVVLNWAREAGKFTPGLRVYVHQGSARAAEADALAEKVAACDVVVTSYALIRRDAEIFETVEWKTVVADEAQNLKNPDALQTRAVKRLRADARLCLTGTPVENHVRDLWSIFDVALPGLLGGPSRFAKTFMTPIREGHAGAMDKLSRRVAPFLLRRLKSDPGVAADLPPKQEQETFCELTREQVALYRAMTEATLEGIVGMDGIERRACILTALMRFKQICNHPENFQPERPEALFGRSGKLDRAMELLRELIDEGQKVLVFTQFTQMGELLVRAIEERLDAEAGFYHGGLTPDAREAMVAAFSDPQGTPVLIVSLKAGGSGLNLTAASAVIHYDRWWNPAVEDQATDRAHRIGQTRMVNVYKFVTRSTLEERIVTMLEGKRELASKVLGGAGEGWITEMDDRALRSFLTLGELSEES